MYTVEHTIFGKYVAVDYKNNLRPAKQAAQKLYNEGWLNIRIITPTGKVIQFHGK